MTFIRRFFMLTLFLVPLLAACNLPSPTQPAAALDATETAVAASETPAPTFFPTPESPTATLPPGPHTFTEEFDSASPYWTFLQIDTGEPAVSPTLESGFLAFDLPSQNQWSYALYEGSSYDDVRVDAHVELRTGGDGAVGIVCRYRPTEGWYEFNIYEDQTYVLLYGQWLAGDVVRYTPLYRSTSEKIHADTDDLGLVCQGNTLTPFINGVQMRKWQETKFNLTDGSIGISAASFQDAPFTAAYDWVKVSQP